MWWINFVAIEETKRLSDSDELRIFFLFPQMSDVILNNQSAEGNRKQEIQYLHFAALPNQTESRIGITDSIAGISV